MTLNVCIYVQKVLAADGLSRREGWQVLPRVCVWCVCVHKCMPRTKVYTITLPQ